MPRGHPGQVKQTGKKSKDPKKDPSLATCLALAQAAAKACPTRLIAT